MLNQIKLIKENWAIFYFFFSEGILFLVKEKKSFSEEMIIFNEEFSQPGIPPTQFLFVYYINPKKRLSLFMWI